MAVPDISIKFDLHGSSQTIGVSRHRHAQAIRRFRATGATNDNQILNNVLVEAIRQAGPFYHAPTVPGVIGPNDPLALMPLRAAKAERFGLKVTGKLFYGFDRSSRPSGALVASFAGSSEAVASYRYPHDADFNPKFSATGLPDGAIYVNETWDLRNKSEGRPTASWMYFRPVVKVEVRARLSFNPIGEVIGLLRRVNSDLVVFGGSNFLATTIRFDHLDVDWVETQFGNAFIVVYKYTIITGGHWKHLVQWIPDQKGPEGQGTWDVVESLVYEPVVFAGKFPF